MGDITGAKKASKRIAKATMEAANLQAQSDRWNAQAAQYAQETAVARDRAATQAAELLTKPPEQVDVQLGPDASAELDPQTGKRKTARAKFNMRPMKSLSGVQI